MDIVDKPFVTQEQKFAYWQESKAEIKSLRNQLAECQKDAERLDYLDTLQDRVTSDMKNNINLNSDLHITKNTVSLFIRNYKGTVDNQGYGKTIREAIDQAMSEKCTSEHVCEECGAATHPYAMGKISGWACSSCGWSQDD